jgi:hypothetical protein
MATNWPERLKLTTTTTERLRAVARRKAYQQEKDLSWQTLARFYIDEGLLRDETGAKK